MILVTVGTHHQPFDRLVRAAADLQQAGLDVVVQAGTSAVPVRGGRALFPPSELRDLAARADVIVCHAAPASVWLAWDAGRVPVVVPRRAAYGEHVDDHQVAWLQGVVEGVVAVDDPARIVADWGALVRATQTITAPPDAGSAGFCAGLDAAIDDAVRASRGRARRATVWRLSRWMRRWT